MFVRLKILIQSKFSRNVSHVGPSFSRKDCKTFARDKCVIPIKNNVTSDLCTKKYHCFYIRPCFLVVGKLKKPHISRL